MPRRSLQRQQQEAASVSSLMDLLRQVDATPDRFAGDEALREAIGSQGALARFEDPDRAILPMSLNHQKRICNDGLGGYAALNALRCTAAARLAALEYGRGKRTRSGLAACVRELEREVLVLKEDLFLLQRAYDLRCQQARQYAIRAGDSVTTLCSREQHELDVSLSLRRRTADAKVTPLRGKRP